jgi:pyruvate kinase
MLRKTKIIATMGPAVDDQMMMERLLQAGMNVGRFNFSHGTHEEQLGRIEMLRRASERTGIPVAILLDTKGPEIRTGKIKDGGKINLQPGHQITLTTEEVPGTTSLLSISYSNLPQEVYPGGHIFIADGLVDLEVIKSGLTEIQCVVRNGGIIGSRKNVNVPGVRTGLPAVTEKDIEDIEFGIANNIDFIAASFIRKATDIAEVQHIVDRHKASTRIIAKIEDEEGLSNIAGIVAASGGVMVARGDLGVQLQTEEIPLAQKRIIRECNLQNKPVITATQMLDSMISNPKPTRAELTDVANAIFDGTDAVMLSGETANGAFPVESVAMLHRIALEVEKSSEYIERSRQYFQFHQSETDISEAITRAAYVVATDIHAAALISPSLRGNSPRLLSKYRPSQPVIAVTTSDVVQRHLLLHWGVYPLLSEYVNDSDKMIQNALRLALKHNYIRRNDKVVSAAGMPLNSPIMMNTIKVHFVGNILNRGHRGFGEICSGNIVKARTLEQAKQRLRMNGMEILLIPELTEDYTPLLGGVRGVLVEQKVFIDLAALQAQFPKLVVVADIRDAYRQFEQNQSISLHGDEKLIYEGWVTP